MGAEALPPGSVIGIFGGGQLGRMTALAAANLGYRCHIFCPDEDSPAFQVCDAKTIAAYDDHGALAAFAKAVDVVTFEFENIPAASVKQIEALVPVRPGWNVLETAQDRIVEKQFFNNLGIATAPWRQVDGPDSLAAAWAEMGLSVLKTTRFGYDGKGQVLMEPGLDPKKAWADMGGDVGILEGFITFEREISVIAARNPSGQCAVYDPVENIHRNHILDRTIAPAALPRAVAEEARAIALKAVAALDLVGLLAVELFVTKDGKLLVNEMAPRPHNSGHWTMDACAVSQFEQFVRAVCGLPLGSTMRHSDAEMQNLLGDEVDTWLEVLAEPNTCLHLYGKAEARPGRKMGHINRIKPFSG